MLHPALLMFVDSVNPRLVAGIALLVIFAIAWVIKMTHAHDKEEERASSPAAGIPRFDAILVLSRDALTAREKSTLLQQIVDQLRSRGWTPSPRFSATVRTAGVEVDSPAYLYAALRQDFPNCGANAIERCREFTFAASNGNSGKYFVVMDRPAASATQPDSHKTEKAS
jgi:hypothetical protein